MTFNHVGFGLGRRRLPIIEQYTAPDGVRFYNTPSGLKYPSITTILAEKSKDVINNWRKRIGPEAANTISRVAAGRGTALHKLAEDHLNNQPLELKSPLVTDLWNKVRPVLDTNINNIHCQETRLFSHHLRLAGTVDCIAEYNGKLSIIDFKTSTGPKRKDWITSYFMQCAAYAIMYEEIACMPITQLVIIVGVEEEPEPQIFVEKRDNWTKELLHWRDHYEDKHNLVYGMENAALTLPV
jgi:genome maintenance exonuclease 1